MSRNRRLKFEAYHEAGHAVLADHFNVLKDARLEPTPAVRHRDLDEDMTCCIKYGGVLAQARYQRCSLAITCITGGGDDLAYVGEVADFRERELLQDSAELRATWCESARKILRPRWPAVRLVASGLLEKGRLDAREVRELVASTGSCAPRRVARPKRSR